MVMCATTSRTRHPSHSDGVSHWASVADSRRSASARNSAATAGCRLASSLMVNSHVRLVICHQVRPDACGALVVARGGGLTSGSVVHHDFGAEWGQSGRPDPVDRGITEPDAAVRDRVWRNGVRSVDRIPAVEVPGPPQLAERRDVHAVYR